MTRFIIYLFKFSQQLLQAEVEANHSGVCALTPPTPSSPYIFSIVIQMEGCFRFRASRQVLQWLWSKPKPSRTGFRSIVNPQFGESRIRQLKNLSFSKTSNTKGSNPGCTPKTGNLHTPWQHSYMHAGVCARPIPPHVGSILL